MHKLAHSFLPSYNLVKNFIAILWALVLFIAITDQHPVSEIITVRRISLSEYEKKDNDTQINANKRTLARNQAQAEKYQNNQVLENDEENYNSQGYSKSFNDINGLTPLNAKSYGGNRFGTGKWYKNHITYTLLNYAPGIRRYEQRAIFRRAFAYWSDVTPLTFKQVRASTADMRIQFADGYHYYIKDGRPCSDSFDGPQRSSRTRSGNKIAHAFHPPSGEIHFDASEHWTDKSYEGFNLESIAVHEIGHALGLHHSYVKGSIMRSFFQGYNPDLQLSPDDVWNIQALYGSKPITKQTIPPSYPVQTTPQPTHPESTSPVPTTDIHTKHTPYPDICRTHFDAIFQGPDSNIYVFKHKWIWKLNEYGIDPGFPRLTRELYEQAPAHPSAVVYSTKSGYTYIFYPYYVLQYWGYTLYRRKFTSRDDYGSPDAAITGFSGEIYILKGRFYWIFDERRLDVTTPYKRRIKDKWYGIPENVEAAMTYNEYHVHFYSRDKYWSYDMIYKKAERGYPKNKSRGWMGLTCP